MVYYTVGPGPTWKKYPHEETTNDLIEERIKSPWLSKKERILGLYPGWTLSGARTLDGVHAATPRPYIKTKGAAQEPSLKPNWRDINDHCIKAPSYPTLDQARSSQVNPKILETNSRSHLHHQSLVVIRYPDLNPRLEISVTTQIVDPIVFDFKFLAQVRPNFILVHHHIYISQHDVGLLPASGAWICIKISYCRGSDSLVFDPLE